MEVLLVWFSLGDAGKNLKKRKGQADEKAKSS